MARRYLNSHLFLSAISTQCITINDILIPRNSTLIGAGMKHKVQSGTPFPLGASIHKDGVNFSIYSKSATSMNLVLFASEDAVTPSARIKLTKQKNRTAHYWHVLVAGIECGQLYGFEVDGPNDLDRGLRFDKEKVLIDPYARALTYGDSYDRGAACIPGSNAHCCMKSAVVDLRGFDWQDTTPPNTALADTVIYEMHVAGFTKHPNSGVSPKKRGTYAGVIEKIPYLKSLGITAIELMPVQMFDPFDAPDGKNYWGYSPINFFAPHLNYSSDKTPLGAFDEFRTMVRELHKAGIEVILDVVFNHTSEGGHDGPIMSFKGLQNDAYYILEKERRWFSNYSGCGNTCNANHSVMRRMIRDALDFWVTHMHVDGFRFDLASVLTRDSQGHVLREPPLLWSIDSDPALAGTKIFAEAWDAAGLYQVGNFVGDRWNEWNGRFRDDVRSFIRGDAGVVGAFSNRLIGSPDIYCKDNHSPQRSVNFVTAHDGFTLNDLVSYTEKHNWDNGERNRDGDNHNISANYGVEGPSDDPALEQLRLRQIKNFFITMLVSTGTPMLSMGDEVRRTQKGNNNAYCQDNELSWFDWSLVEKNDELLRFVRKAIAFRNYDQALDRTNHASLNELLNETNIDWHGTTPFQPDWSEHSHSLALSIVNPYAKDRIYIAFNSYWEDLEFTLPDYGEYWHILVNTAAEPPHDIFTFNDAPPMTREKVIIPAHSVLILVANPLVSKRIR